MHRPPHRVLVLATVLLLGVGLVACSGDDAAAPGTTAAPTTAPDTVADTTAPDTTAATVDLATVEWTEIVPGGDCECSDGSEYSFFERPADPTKVVLWFQGGGACFDGFTCAPATATYTTSITDASRPDTSPGGIFDLTDPRNPIADHSIVFVPYCTGDVHIGTKVTEYQTADGPLTVRHKGYVNATAALEHLLASYPDATTVLVGGESAGSIPSPLFGALVADGLPGADVTVLGDSSGGYPDVAPVNAAIGALWGTMGAVPDWPVNAGMTPERWSIPGLYEQAGRHAPQVQMARFDYADDGVQRQFSQLAGVGGDTLLPAIDANDARIRAAGVQFVTYTAPGTEHTVMRSAPFYELEVGGVALADWVRSLLADEPVDDVRCTDCG